MATTGSVQDAWDKVTESCGMKCDVCNVTLNSLGQYQQHMGGKIHAKKLRQAQGLNQPPQPKQPKLPNQSGDGRGK
jgi:hypothetical protein